MSNDVLSPLESIDSDAVHPSLMSTTFPLSRSRARFAIGDHGISLRMDDEVDVRSTL